MDSKRGLLAIGIAALLVLAAPQGGRADGDAPVAAVGIATPAAPRGEKSQLPYSTGGNARVDASGVIPVDNPQIPKDAVTRVRVVIFQPKDDQLSWPSFELLYTAGGFLKPDAKPALQLTGDIAGIDVNPPGVLNAKETNVYVPDIGGDRLVLGFVRNQHTRHLYCYGVLIQGKLDNLPALIYARLVVNSFGGILTAPPQEPEAPAGFAKGKVTNLRGPQLGQLNRAIQSGAFSPRLKRILQGVLGQARSITFTQFSGPLMPDGGAAWFTQLSNRRGWLPITRDTRGGGATLFYQKPIGGVVLIESNSNGNGTSVSWLDIDGPFDVSKL